METYSDWLAHHGILGMRWGKRNGPPYPLNESQKSRREKIFDSKIEGVQLSIRKDKNRINKLYDLDLKGQKAEDFREKAKKSIEMMDDSLDSYNKRILEEYESYVLKNGKHKKELDDYVLQRLDSELRYQKERHPDFPEEELYKLYSFDDVGNYVDAFVNEKVSKFVRNDMAGQRISLYNNLDRMNQNLKDYTYELVGGVANQPIRNFGRYKNITYKDLVEHYLDPTDWKGYVDAIVKKKILNDQMSSPLQWYVADGEKLYLTHEAKDAYVIPKDRINEKAFAYHRIKNGLEAYNNGSSDYYKNKRYELVDELSGFLNKNNVLSKKELNDIADEVFTDKKHVAKLNTAEKIKGVSPLAYLIDQAGKYDKKSFDPELADLTLMEYEDVTGKTISDSEWSKIIDEYKKS